MVQRNAPLTPTGRLRLARCVIEHGWTLRQAARTGPAASTCHRILRRHGLPPLTVLDRATKWAYARLYSCKAERQAAYPGFLDWYNYHRPHTGIGGQVPAARVTNLTEQHI